MLCQELCGLVASVCVCVVVIKVAGCAQTFPRNIDTNETKDMIHVAQPQLMAFRSPSACEYVKIFLALV